MTKRDWSRIDRRGFLAALGAGTVAVGAGTLGALDTTPAHAQETAGGGKGPPAFPPGRIGIQLYSIRTIIPELGFSRVFETLSDMGYREVEFFGYDQGDAGPITVEEIRRALDNNGLRAVGAHRGIDLWRSNLEEELDNAEILGLRHVGTADPPTGWDGGETVDDYRAAAEEFNIWGAAAAERGITFYQHNHAGEFGFASDDPDQRLYDIFLECTDPAAVSLQMDIYWAYAGQHRFGGFEPADYVIDNPDRFPLFHVKDGARNPDNPDGYDMIEFGAGDIDFRSFFRRLHTHGVRSYRPQWEQDNAHETAVPPHPIDPLGNAERSYDAMRELRLGPPGQGRHDD